MSFKRLITIGMSVVLLVLLAMTASVGSAQNFGSNWTGQYYANTTFSGDPAIVAVDQAINFTYGAGSPYPGFIPADNFSVRWTGFQTIPAGSYEFIASAQDGVRVTVDGQVFINQLDAGGSFQTFSAVGNLVGDQHLIVVEFVARTGNAAIQFQWRQTAAAPADTTPEATPRPTATPLPAIPAGALRATVIRASVLNVRAAPSLGGDRVGQILRGQTYAVVGRNEDARWFLLQLSGFQAWAYGYYLFIDGNEFNAPVTSAVAVFGLPAGVTDTGVLAQTRAVMRLRAEPTTLSAQTGRVTWGAFVPVIGKTADGTWYQVVWRGTIGWLWSGYLRVTQGDMANVPVVR